MSNSFRMRPYGQSLAIIVFGPSSLRHLQCLKAEYQHCSVITQDRGLWHMMDPLLNGTHIRVLGETGQLKLYVYLKMMDMMQSQIRALLRSAREMPWALYICVEAVKRVPGIQDRCLLTPWQLRQSLSRFYGYQ